MAAVNKTGRSGASRARYLRPLERGEDSSFEFTTMIVPMILMILMVTFATLVRAAQMPVWTAASECARVGIATESKSDGSQQGVNAAYQALSGYTIDPASVYVSITGDADDTGNWLLDTPVTCQVSYNIDTSHLAFFSELTAGHVPMAAQVTLRTESYQSRWPVTPTPMP